MTKTYHGEVSTKNDNLESRLGLSSWPQDVIFDGSEIIRLNWTFDLQIQKRSAEDNSDD